MRRVRVYARPRIAILSTGNEIVEPGQPLAPGQIYDINRFTLAAVVCRARRRAGARTARRNDTLEDLSRALDDCLQEDVLVFSGGSSVGERDLILDVLAARGEVIFHGIAVKPGKPTAFGRVSESSSSACPATPTSCLSNAYILLAPALRRMARLAPAAVRSIDAAAEPPDRVGAGPPPVLYRQDRGRRSAVPAFKASGDITSMSQADGYIEIAADTDVVEKGEMVEVKLF